MSLICFSSPSGSTHYIMHNSSETRGWSRLAHVIHGVDIVVLSTETLYHKPKRRFCGTVPPNVYFSM